MARRIDPALIPPRPTLEFEVALWGAGLEHLAGIDEAGRGCLAGPVAAAAVVLPCQSENNLLDHVRDSKQLSLQQREKVRSLIDQSCLSWGVGLASSQEIDHLGILPATRLAASRALDNLAVFPQHLLIDYLVLPDNPLPQTRLVKGDARSLSIAAASIMAKTERDRIMAAAADQYPQYGFTTNRGYGTKEHLSALEKFGPCPLHRLSFSPLAPKI